jgi:hypothetical protein
MPDNVEQMQTSKVLYAYLETTHFVACFLTSAHCSSINIIQPSDQEDHGKEIMEQKSYTVHHTSLPSNILHHIHPAEPPDERHLKAEWQQRRSNFCSG